MLIAIMLLLGLAACRTIPPQSATASAPAVLLPTIDPLPGSIDYRIVPAKSELRVLVYRAGPLAALGHNHVLVHNQIQGHIHWHAQPSRTRFALQLGVDDFIVDPAPARRSAGPAFNSQPDPKDITGTRSNLLGPQVLDAHQYPWIRIRSVSVQGPAWQPNVTAAIQLHGITRQLSMPVAVFRHDEQLIVIGHFDLRPSDFGIPAFSVLGGALRVRDAVQIRFRLHALATPQPVDLQHNNKAGSGS